MTPLNQPGHSALSQANGLAAFGFTNEIKHSRSKVWLTVILLALLVHLFASLTQINWGPNAAPLQVDIHPVDPAKLDAIRKQWSRQKSILIDRDKSRPNEVSAPKDARYFSDKNIRVEKEQRARETQVLPHAGAQGPRSEQASQKKIQPSAQTKSNPLPLLGNLGVPLHLDRRSLPATKDNLRQVRQNAGEEGGDQAVLERDLPQGSQNLLNAEESVFYSFYSRMYEAIAPVWQSRIREVANTTRVAAGEYTTSVDVVLDPSGNLIAVRRIHSSGIASFDRAVDDALAKTGHFPNPPKELLNPAGEVHTGWTFTVSLQQGTGYNFLPPERVY